MNIITHNLAAMNASRQFHISANTQKQATEKLSSGYRINRAADDATGLSISEKMRGQIRGLTQGVENTQAGVSLCQVADGALAEVNNMLQRITELSVQSANGTNSDSDRNAIQEEINQILQEINRISDTTTFNTQPLFRNDSLSSVNISSTIDHVSSIQNSFTSNSDGLSQTDTTYLSNYSLTADANGISCNYETILWSNITNATGQSLAEVPISSGDYSFTFFTASNQADITISFSVDEGATLDDVITAINGTLCEFTPKTYNPLQIIAPKISMAPKAEDFLLDSPSKKFLADEQGLSIENYGSMTWEQMGIDINNLGGQTGTFVDSECGVSFTFTIDNRTSKEDLIWGFNQSNLSSSLSPTLYDTETGARLYAFDISYAQSTPDAAFTDISLGTGSGYIALSDEAAMNALGCQTPSERLTQSFSITTTGSNASDLKIIITADNGNFIELNYKGWRSYSDSYNTVSGPYFESSYGAAHYYAFPSVDSPSAEQLAYLGNLGVLSNNTLLRNPYSIKALPITLPDGADMTWTLPEHFSESGNNINNHLATSGQIFIQSGCDTMDGIILEIDKMSTQTLGIRDLNVSTIEGADRAIKAMDIALKRLSTTRSKIGAQQNRLEHTIANEENIVENTTASESRIRDTDMAAELVQHSTNNILLQAGQAMLAQANQSTQSVLTLLQ